MAKIEKLMWNCPNITKIEFLLYQIIQNFKIMNLFASSDIFKIRGSNSRFIWIDPHSYEELAIGCLTVTMGSNYAMIQYNKFLAQINSFLINFPVTIIIIIILLILMMLHNNIIGSDQFILN